MLLSNQAEYNVNAGTPSKRRIIELKLSEEALEEILAGNSPLSIDMTQSKLLVGSTHFDFTQLPSTGPAEVFKSQPGNGPQQSLDLVGNIASRFTVKRSILAQGRQPKPTKHQPVRTTQMLNSTNELNHSTKATPAQRKIRSVSPPTTPSNTSAVVPLRTRIIQLLAKQPRGSGSIDVLQKQTKLSMSDLQGILPQIATGSGSVYTLKPETYREVKVNEWSMYSAKERATVVENASAAFDKLGLPEDAAERRKLIPEKSRHSPPTVADGYPNGLLDNNKMRRMTGAGIRAAGSESEGPESKSGSVSKPKKRVSAKKTLTASKSSKQKGKGVSAADMMSKVLDLQPKNVPPIGNSGNGLSIPTKPNGHGTMTTPLSSTATTTTTTGTTTAITSLAAASKNGSLAGNGNGNGNGAGPHHAETKKAKRESGGVSNGYKIPKMSNGAVASNGSASNGGARPPPQPVFAIPPITNQKEFAEAEASFRKKYQQLKILEAKVKSKREEYQNLGAELERAAGTDKENELKRKLRDAFGEEVPDRKLMRLNGEPRAGVSAERVAALKADRMLCPNVQVLVENYKYAHEELKLLKEALWKAGTAPARSPTAASTAATGTGSNT